jgi:hypothetical protein
LSGFAIRFPPRALGRYIKILRGKLIISKQEHAVSNGGPVGAKNLLEY